MNIPVTVHVCNIVYNISEVRGGIRMIVKVAWVQFNIFHYDFPKHDLYVILECYALLWDALEWKL